MNRNCTNCGSSLRDSDNFCERCGTRAPAYPGPAHASSPAVAPPKPGNRRRWLAMLGMPALIVVVLLIWARSRHGKAEGRSAPAVPQPSQSQNTNAPPPTVTPANKETAASPTDAYPEWQPTVQPPKISLVPELTIVTAIAHPSAGDYESIKRIQEVNNEAVEVAYSSDILGAIPSANSSAAPPRRSCVRTVLRQDLRDATQYHENFCAANQESYPGTTAIGVSAQVLADLKNKGEANIKYQTTENVGDPDQVCVLKRVEATDVAIPVLVNDRREQLPAVHARCAPSPFETPSEFYFLDDTDNPLALSWQLASANKLQVVKITVPTKAPQIEQALEQTGRAEVYGIYFDFASASIRPESKPVLMEIAGVLEKNPAWKLSIEGHTDNVGNDAYNQDLSRRRAEAVKQSLVEQYDVPAGRLTTAGFGASRPKETNNTLEGRARNRRVELVRQPS